MAIILDADVVIPGEKGAFDLQRWVVARPDEQFEVAAVTVAELWHGVERARERTGRSASNTFAPFWLHCRSFPTRNSRPTNMPRLGGIGNVRQDDWML